MRKDFTFFAFVMMLFANSAIVCAQIVDGEDAHLSNCKGDYFDYYRKPANAKVDYGFVVTDYGEYDESRGTGYRLEYHDGILTVSWFNYINDCGLPLEAITMEQKGNMLLFGIRIDEDEPVADCICVYDLKATFSGVEPGHYKVSFNHGWSYSEIELRDSSNNPTDSIIYKNDMIVTDVKGIDAENNCRLQKTGHYLTAISDSKANVEIYDANGIKMVGMSIEPGDTIDLSTLTKGIYTARISNRKSSSTIHFIR